MTTAQQPPIYRTGEEYRPGRKYLHAANWFFLALKVFGYNILGYLLIVLPLVLVFYFIGSASR